MTVTQGDVAVRALNGITSCGHVLTCCSALAYLGNLH